MASEHYRNTTQKPFYGLQAHKDEMLTTETGTLDNATTTRIRMTEQLEIRKFLSCLKLSIYWRSNVHQHTDEKKKFFIFIVLCPVKHCILQRKICSTLLPFTLVRI